MEFGISTERAKSIVIVSTLPCFEWCYSTANLDIQENSRLETKATDVSYEIQNMGGSEK